MFRNGASQNFIESESKLFDVDSTKNYILSFYYSYNSEIEEITVLKNDSLFSNDTIELTYEFVNPYYCMTRKYNGLLISIGKYYTPLDLPKVTIEKDGKWFYWNELGLLERVEYWDKGTLQRSFNFINP